MSRRKLTPILVAAGLLVVVAGFVAELMYERYRENRFDDLIREVAEQYKVDPCLVKAVIWRETRFKPNAVGGAGEIGLMQLMPATAQDWADAVKRKNFRTADLFDPRTNIEAGAWYLRRGLDYWKQCDEPTAFAVAEYNAGRGRVKQWMKPEFERDAGAFVEAIGIASTKRYAQTVLERYEYYKRRGDFLKK